MDEKENRGNSEGKPGIEASNQRATTGTPGAAAGTPGNEASYQRIEQQET